MQLIEDKVVFPFLQVFGPDLGEIGRGSPTMRIFGQTGRLLMRKPILILLLVVGLIRAYGQPTPLRIAVIGSSTSACFGFAGGITDGNCWINRVVNHYSANGYSVTLHNMAVSGYFVYAGMPTGSPGVLVNGGFYTVDVERNITKALSFTPDVIFVNYPSNLYDVANVSDILTYFRVIFTTAQITNTPCFITTSQPRNFDLNGRNKLKLIKDSILAEYGYFALNFWDNFANADGTISATYGQGDGIHLNAVAHDSMAQRTIAKSIPVARYLHRSRTSGNWGDASSWEKGRVPSVDDSVVIQNGHLIQGNASGQLRSLTIAAGGNLALSNPSVTVVVGASNQAKEDLNLMGTLQLSAGEIRINGRLQAVAGSHFSLTGGRLVIDGNTGSAASSVANGRHLFDISSSMGSFTFSGGILRIVDPPAGSGSRTLNCTYDFGDLSNLELGDGVSVTPGGHSDGFGGAGYPSRIGRLTVNAVVSSDNRVMRITQALTVKSSVTVTSGHLIQAAPVTVEN